MNITNIEVAKQHGNRDRVLTAQNGTKTETAIPPNNVQIDIVATNAQTENGGPNDRDDYYITYRNNVGFPGNEYRMRLHNQNGNTYTFRKVE